jgi:hypothetical protein
VEDRIRVRFEVHRSAPGHRWTIRIFRQGPVGPEYLVFHGTSVASVAGDFVVQRFYRDNNRGRLHRQGEGVEGGSGMRGARLDRMTGDRAAASPSSPSRRRATGARAAPARLRLRALSRPPVRPRIGRLANRVCGSFGRY